MVSKGKVISIADGDTVTILRVRKMIRFFFMATYLLLPDQT